MVKNFDHLVAGCKNVLIPYFSLISTEIATFYSNLE